MTLQTPLWTSRLDSARWRSEFAIDSRTKQQLRGNAVASGAVVFVAAPDDKSARASGAPPTPLERPLL
jgi:hypothetical protein